MPASTEATGHTGRSYISAHSADVILSDVRPVKLKSEALRSINVLLDEFLYSILNSSRSLATDKLRAGLLSILPTALGKEALLEAEVELRAYLDRTKNSKGINAPVDDDKDTFNLEWSFQLLRLKCEAYSTLNEADEDPDAESRIQERLSHGGAIAPKPALVAPAALYLTAILDSRSAATVQDLFIALCEDHSIYALFKSMNVYEQIEHLSKSPKPRRSKSFSRSDKQTTSRTSSHQEPSSSTKDSSTPPPAGRFSSEISVTTTLIGGHSSRSSIDKGRGMKKFMNSRASNDGEGHKRSDSTLSEETKQTLAAYNRQPSLEDPSLQEFDDLMRSESTLKVSLTPDRLKTMEVYKQEKDRGNRRPSPLLVGKPDVPPASSNPPSRANGRRPSLAQVNPIVEDDEEIIKSPPKTRSFASNTDNPGHSRKSTLTESTMPPPTRQFTGGPKGFDAEPFPQKKRRIQHNRESLDLDAVMAGSDDDDDDEEPVAEAPKNTVSSPKPLPPKRTVKVSQTTRDLMNFLDEGPPEAPPVSKAGRELMDFLAEGPPDAGYGGGYSSSGFNSSMESGKNNKGSGRLQRMISKLSIGGAAEKARAEEISRGSPRKAPSTPLRSQVHTQSSSSNLAALANRPIPPRPPPISPPSSPSDEQYGHQAAVNRRGGSAWEQNAPLAAVPAKTYENGHGNDINGAKSEVEESARRPTPHKASANVVTGDSIVKTASPPVKSSSKPSTPPTAPATSRITPTDVQELRRMMTRATSADECRLIMDMFLAKSGTPLEPADFDVPYPSPSLSDKPEKPSGADTPLENSVVELFLGGEMPVEVLPRKRNLTTRKKVPTIHPSLSQGSPASQNTSVSAAA
ncbi:hypothetical protein C8J56DRAFT_935648 [Mycena floridula]|nr:hypothetical protein C8J56DRAFT_935648 [Mycena floridula]